MIQNFAFDFAFEVVGAYKESSDIPLSVIIDAARKRLSSLEEIPEDHARQAFNMFDVHTEDEDADDTDDET